MASLLLLSWDLWFAGHPDQSLCACSGSACSWLKNWPSLYSASADHGFGRSPPARGRGSARPMKPLEKRVDIARAAVSVTRFVETFGRSAIGDLGPWTRLGPNSAWESKKRRHDGVAPCLLMMDSLGLADTYNKAAKTNTRFRLSRGPGQYRLRQIMGTELHRQRAQIPWQSIHRRREAGLLSSGSSIEVARSQSAKSLELRAVGSLAEIWRTLGRV